MLADFTNVMAGAATVGMAAVEVSLTADPVGELPFRSSGVGDAASVDIRLCRCVSGGATTDAPGASVVTPLQSMADRPCIGSATVTEVQRHVAAVGDLVGVRHDLTRGGDLVNRPTWPARSREPGLRAGSLWTAR